ncbi:MAG: tetratricopeptide repeat protein, partial [Bacteroidetes bacterium]|nr:tetratricopeptide repeat protein [Bacteroidota bacterium]
FFLENDPESTRSEIVRKSLLTKVQKEPDQPLFSEMLIWFSMQQKNFSLALTQAKSLFRRFGESGERIYDLGKLAAANGDYDNALDAFGFIVEKGPSQPFYVVCRLEFLNTRFMKITGSLLTTREELLQLEKDFEVEIGRQYENVQHAMLIRNLAHLETFYLKNREKGMLLLEKLIENPSLPSKSLAESKLELADIYLFSGEVWEATLLYQQVYKAFQNDELGQMAKYRNAKLSFYIGEFDWARVQLDVLRAATSKLIANDAMALSLLISENLDIDSSYGALSLYAKADLLAFRHEYDSVIYFLDAIPAQYGWHSLLDDALFRKAEIHAAKGEYLIADSLYAAVNATYPDDLLADDALLRRAQLQESVFKNKEKAMVFYQDLFIKYPSSLYASDARKRFRILRGDPIE